MGRAKRYQGKKSVVEEDYPPIIKVGETYEIAEVGSVKVLDIITVIPNDDQTVSRRVDFDRYSSTVDIPEELLKGAKITIKMPKTPRQKQDKFDQMSLREFVKVIEKEQSVETKTGGDSGASEEYRTI